MSIYKVGYVGTGNVVRRPKMMASTSELEQHGKLRFQIKACLHAFAQPATPTDEAALAACLLPTLSSAYDLFGELSDMFVAGNSER